MTEGRRRRRVGRRGAAAATVRLAVTGLRRRGIGQVVTLVLVAGLAATAIVAGLAARTSAGDLADRAYERAGRPDVVLYGSAEALRRFADDDAVAAASAPAPRAFPGTTQADGEPTQVLLTGVDPEALPSVATPELTDGRWPAVGSTDEIVVERSMLHEDVVELGGTLPIDRAGGTRHLRVVGAARDVTDCFWPTCDPLRIFGSLALVDDLNGDAPARYVAAYRLHDPDDALEVQTRLLRDRSYDLDGGNVWPDTREDILIIGGVFSAMLSGFGSFLLAAACIVISGATAARLVARRRSLGLLKAIGFRPAQLTVAVLVEHLVIGAVGVLAGWCLGSALAPSVQPGVDGVLGDAAANFETSALVIALVLVEGFLAVSVVVPAWRAGRQSAAEVLRDAPPVPNGGGRVAWLVRRLGAGPATVSGVRRSFARPARAALAGAAIAVAVVGGIFAGSNVRSVDRAMDDTRWAGDPGDVFVLGVGATEPEIEAALADLPEVTGWYTERAFNGTVGDGTYRVKVVGGDPAAADFVVQSGRSIDGPGEAMVGYGFLDGTGLSIGDVLSIEIDGAHYELPIVGWYLDFDDSGEVVQVRAETFEPEQLAAAVPSFRVEVVDGADPAAVAEAITSRLSGRAQAAPFDADAGEFGAMITALTMLAAVLGFVAVANLVAVTLAAARERARAIGVLRTVGCTTGQLIAQSAAGAGAIGLVAALVALPLGLILNRLMADAIAVSTGIGPGVAIPPSPLFLAALVPLAALLAAAAGAVATIGLARKPAAVLVRYE